MCSMVFVTYKNYFVLCCNMEVNLQLNKSQTFPVLCIVCKIGNMSMAKVSCVHKPGVVIKLIQSTKCIDVDIWLLQMM
jgi:hypothetical protein